MASAMNIPGRSSTGTQATRGPGTTDIKPRVTDLMNILAEIAPQYLDIGTALNVPMSSLGLHPLPQYYNDNLRRTLQWWLDNESTVGSYDSIIEAIKGPVVQNFRVSENLRKFYEQLKEDQPMSLANNETGPSDDTQYDENHTPNIPQNTLPLEAQSSGIAHSSASHSLPPLPSVPFTLLHKPGRVSTCFGCGKKFSKRVKRLLIVHHKDYRKYTRPRSGLPSQKFGNVYYHLKMTCIEKNLGRSIPASYFVVPDRVKEELSPDEKAKIYSELNITI